MLIVLLKGGPFVEGYDRAINMEDFFNVEDKS